MEDKVATVVEIHPVLVRRYRNVYTASSQAAREGARGSSLDQLRIMRREVTTDPGPLTIAQRADMRAWQDVLDELIERKTGRQSHG